MNFALKKKSRHKTFIWDYRIQIPFSFQNEPFTLLESNSNKWLDLCRCETKMTFLEWLNTPYESDYTHQEKLIVYPIDNESAKTVIGKKASLLIRLQKDLPWNSQ